MGCEFYKENHHPLGCTELTSARLQILGGFYLFVSVLFSFFVLFLFFNYVLARI